jgi:hypothetical protein
VVGIATIPQLSLGGRTSAYVQPLERVVGAFVTLTKGTVTHHTATNGNGQFRMPIDSGVWHIAIVHEGQPIADLDLPPLADSIVPRVVFSIIRPKGSTMYTETSSCARPPGWVDTLRSVPRRARD